MGRVDILSASAGSGKTYRLTLSYIKRLLEEPYNYRHILAVTFTNKATDELKGRILRELNALATGSKSDFDSELHTLGYDPEEVRRNASLARSLILHDYNNFAVLTIDKFFQRIMRAFIKEAGIDVNFNLELHPDTLLERATETLLEKVTTNKDLYRWVIGYIDDQMNESKSWNIKSAIATLGKQLFNEEYKSAQIGSEDKPELENILHTLAAKEAILHKEYQLLGEMFVAIMDNYGLAAGDFKDGNRSSVGVLAQKIASGEIAEPKSTAHKAVENGEWRSKSGKNPAFATIDAIADRELRPIIARIIELYPDVLKAHNTKQVVAKHYRDFALLADLRSCLDEICAQEEILPLADVSGIINQLVSNNDTPFIYEKAGNRYDYFMIDEFQDTSAVQWQNFVPLLRNALSQSEEAPVLLVGDVKQSIYRWRGGDWTLLSKGVKEEFGDVREEPLVINRRSSKSVVEFNNLLTEAATQYITNDIKGHTQKALDNGSISTSLAARAPKSAEEAYATFRQEVKPKATDGYVSVELYGDKEEDCYEPLIRRIEELQSRGFRAKDIAILVRGNKEGADIASRLLAHKNDPERTDNYVFDVVTEEALTISTSSAVRFITSCLTLTFNHTDKIALALYNEYIGRPIAEPLSTEEQEFIYSLSLLQPEEAFNELLLHYPSLSRAEEIPYIQALHNQIISYCSKNISDTALFMKWWQESGSKESVSLPQESDAITISTIHKSKGLGYMAVIIPKCNWNIRPRSKSLFWTKPNKPLSDKITKFPASFVQDMATSDFAESYLEELTMSDIDALNILYVAITRAIEELHILLPYKSNERIPNNIGVAVRSFIGMNQVGDKYEYGTPQQFTSPERKEASLSRFQTHSPTNKVAVRYSHQRYDEESRGENLQPREFGVLMHRAMEGATTMEDIERQIGLIVTDGIITPEEATPLKEKIIASLKEHGVEEWFDGSWQQVKSEREIVSDGKSWRPDRVMIRDKEAVIVDYKFGLNRPKSYANKISRYCKLLQEMGYEKVSGYLWYITLGDIEKVV